MFVLLPAISLEVDQFKNSCVLKLSQLYRHRKKKERERKKRYEGMVCSDWTRVESVVGISSVIDAEETFLSRWLTSFSHALMHNCVDQGPL